MFPIEHKYTREERLLIYSSKTIPDRKEQVAKLIENGIDWEQLLRLAKQHGVAQLLYQTLYTHFAELVPAVVIDNLQQYYQSSAQQNLRYTYTLLELVEKIRQKDIPAIPYRGPVLSSVAFDDVSLRKFGDLDILVRQQDITDVKQVLTEQGYQPQYWLPSTKSLTEVQERAYTRFCRDYPFKNEDGIVVELHWRVISRHFPTSITLDTVWDRREQISIGGQQIDALSPEDRLLMLCVHGSRHNWERLGWIVDVAEVLEQHSVDWSLLQHRTQTHNCQRMFVLGLLLARDLFNSDLPPYVAEFVREDSKIEQLRVKHHQYLFDPTYPKNHATYQSQSRMLDNFSDKARFWLRWAVNPDRPGIESVALPDERLYPVVRVGRLLTLFRRRLKQKATGRRK